MRQIENNMHLPRLAAAGLQGCMFAGDTGMPSAAESRLPAPGERAVYVVDDNPMICSALDMLLAAHDYSVVTYTSGEAFLADSSVSANGCLLVDLLLPNLSGIDILMSVRQRLPNMPVIFMSGHGEVRTAVEAMKLGAVDFLQKPIDDLALLALLQQVAPPAAVELPLAAPAVMDRLTCREREILQQLAGGLTSKQIARLLDISPRTVDVHRCNILAKLGATSILAAIRMVGMEA